MDLKLNYRPVYAAEKFGERHSFGIQILLAVERELTEEERFAIYRLVDGVEDIVQRASVKLNPVEEGLRQQERMEILRVFPDPIFVEEIPNGYCSQWCCSQKPWFIVTTRVGRITIGWRKRVISIDWSGSTVAASAEELFPEENVTKEGWLIHALGYAKAATYIAKILEAGK